MMGETTMEEEKYMHFDHEDQPLKKETIDISSIVFKHMVAVIMLAALACAIQFIGAIQLHDEIVETVIQRATKLSEEIVDKNHIRYFEVNVYAFIAAYVFFALSVIVADVSMIKRLKGQVVVKKDIAMAIIVFGTILSFFLLVMALNICEIEKPKNLGWVTIISWPVILFVNFSLFVILSKKDKSRRYGDDDAY